MGQTRDETTEDFSRRMTEILNHGALNLAMAIGYQTGIFDAMDELGKPADLDAIAVAAEIDARYLKEWLGVMVCGGIIELSGSEAGEERFHLPRSRADLLTRRAGNANMGVYTQEIPLLIQLALEPVLNGFRTGEGVSYSHYPRFQAFMTELADAKHRQVLVDRFLPSVEEGEMVNRLKEGIEVCDLGCGEGVAPLLMAEAFPESRFTGVDISREAIDIARREAARRELKNLSFRIVDAVDMKADPRAGERFDYVTAFDAIHDQTHPLEALQAVYAILKPGGRFSMIDIASHTAIGENKDHPMGPFLYTVSLMHCMPVGRVKGGAGLGMMWGKERAVEMLSEAGFQDVDVQPIPDDPFNFHFFCRK